MIPDLGPRTGSALVAAILGDNKAEAQSAQTALSGYLLRQLSSEQLRQKWIRFELPPGISPSNKAERTWRINRNVGTLETLAWAVATMREAQDDPRITAKLSDLEAWIKSEWRCGDLPPNCVFERWAWARKVCRDA